LPHVTIKHFPASLDDEQRSDLAAALTAAVQRAFDCPEGVVSIALEAVPADAWHEQVYVPEILDRAALLCKTPDYYAR
jgi:4-oxalocrotonate tautomerase